MKYCVLTYVPVPTPEATIPKSGETLVFTAYEEGCPRCVINSKGKVDICWKHTRIHALWARTVEVEDEEVMPSDTGR